MRRATIARPYLDCCSWKIVRVFVQVSGQLGLEELDLVDADTGVVVYTTPVAFRSPFTGSDIRTPRGTALWSAATRAHNWARRHGLEVVS